MRGCLLAMPLLLVHKKSQNTFGIITVCGYISDITRYITTVSHSQQIIDWNRTPHYRYFEADIFPILYDLYDLYDLYELYDLYDLYDLNDL